MFKMSWIEQKFLRSRTETCRLHRISADLFRFQLENLMRQGYIYRELK